MALFLFYLAAILILFALLAAIAELIGWLYPDWLTEAEADESLEDSTTTKGSVI